MFDELVDYFHTARLKAGSFRPLLELFELFFSPG